MKSNDISMRRLSREEKRQEEMEYCKKLLANNIKLKLKEAKTLDKQLEIIQANGCELFRQAIRDNLPEAVKYLLEVTDGYPVIQNMMINTSEVFNLFATQVYGFPMNADNLEILLKVTKQYPILQKQLIKYGDQVLLQPAHYQFIGNNIFEQVARYQFIGNNIFEQVARYQFIDNHIFKLAALYESIEIMKLVFETVETPQLQQELIKQEFKLMVSRAKRKSAEFLFELAKNFGMQETIIQENKYNAFNYGSRVGDSEVTKLLIKATDDDLAAQKEMIQMQYEYFTDAVIDQDTKVVQRIIKVTEKYPEIQKEMIENANNIIQSYNKTKFNESLPLLKFLDALIKSNTENIKSIIKEHHNDEWLKEIIHLCGDKAMKLMIWNADVEGIKLLSSLDQTCKKW